MRYEKRTVVPKVKDAVLRYTPERLQKEGELHLFHLREGANGFELAEGAEYLFAVSETATRLFEVPDELFVYEPPLRRFLRPLTEGKDFYAGVDTEPTFVVSVYVGESRWGYYVCNDREIHYLIGGLSSCEDHGDYFGATAGIWFKERFFFTFGKRLYYTQAGVLDYFENYKSNPEGFGYVDLFSSTDGDLMGLFALDGTLYIFRERGLLEMRVGGDQLNYRAQRLEYGCGRFIANSLVDCGGTACFLTEKGLFSFDGKSCKLLDDKLMDEIVLEKRPFEACCVGTTYYALLMRKNGKRAIYAYDHLRGKAHWLNVEAESIGGLKSLYVRYDLGVYRL